MEYIWQNVRLLRLILCFMPDAIMYREASSMFVEQVLKTYVSSPVVMLDLCAAPGGKSTAARAVLPDGSLLVANEVMRNRVQIFSRESY